MQVAFFVAVVGVALCGTAQAQAPIPLLGGNDAAATNLQACTGECDADSQCATGLTCFQRENGEPIPGCSGAGGDPTWDYCAAPYCCPRIMVDLDESYNGYNMGGNAVHLRGEYTMGTGTSAIWIKDVSPFGRYQFHYHPSYRHWYISIVDNNNNIEYLPGHSSHNGATCPNNSTGWWMAAHSRVTQGPFHQRPWPSVTITCMAQWVAVECPNHARCRVGHCDAMGRPGYCGGVDGTGCMPAYTADLCGSGGCACYHPPPSPTEPHTSAPTRVVLTGTPTRPPTTSEPTTSEPTSAPTTSAPTRSPTTSEPTTSAPTRSPTTSEPTTPGPTTSEPTSSPIDCSISELSDTKPLEFCVTGFGDGDCDTCPTFNDQCMFTCSGCDPSLSSSSSSSSTADISLYVGIGGAACAVALVALAVRWQRRQHAPAADSSSDQPNITVAGNAVQNQAFTLPHQTESRPRRGDEVPSLLQFPSLSTDEVEAALLASGKVGARGSGIFCLRRVSGTEVLSLTMSTVEVAHYNIRRLQDTTTQPPSTTVHLGFDTGIGPGFTTVAELLKHYKSCPVNETGPPVTLHASLVQRSAGGPEVTYAAINYDEVRSVEMDGMYETIDDDEQTCNTYQEPMTENPGYADSETRAAIEYALPTEVDTADTTYEVPPLMLILEVEESRRQHTDSEV